jgi:hypothetical protein
MQAETTSLLQLQVFKRVAAEGDLQTLVLPEHRALAVLAVTVASWS